MAHFLIEISSLISPGAYRRIGGEMSSSDSELSSLGDEVQSCTSFSAASSLLADCQRACDGAQPRHKSSLRETGWCDAKQ